MFQCFWQCFNVFSLFLVFFPFVLRPLGLIWGVILGNFEVTLKLICAYFAAILGAILGYFEGL